MWKHTIRALGHLWIKDTSARFFNERVRVGSEASLIRVVALLNTWKLPLRHAVGKVEGNTSCFAHTTSEVCTTLSCTRVMVPGPQLWTAGLVVGPSSDMLECIALDELVRTQLRVGRAGSRKSKDSHKG